MNLQEIKEVIINHLDGLQEYLDEASYYDYDYNEEQLLQNITVLKDACEAQWFESGATKFVLGFKDLPGYVVKIPFQGYRVFEDDERGGDDDDTYYLVDDRSFSYSHADPTFGNLKLENEWDYCEAEEKIYAAAPDCIKKILVNTTYVCSIGNTPIYVSEEMISEFDWSDAKSTSKVSQDLARSISCNIYSLTEEILSVIIEQQGIEATNELVAFVRQYGLNDFHVGNLMYDENNILRFIDYAGYNE